MQSRVAERYAKALLDLANEQNELSEVYSDMQSFKQTLAQSRELELLMNNPVVNTDKKNQIFTQIFKENYNPLTFGFLSLILKKRRESNFADIAQSFIDLYNQQEGITHVKVTTAVPVDDATIQEIVAKIKKEQQLKTVELEQEVNPKLIGGFIAEFDNQILDQSIQTNLNQIKRRFNAN